MDYGSLFLDMNGRISRKPFWLGTGILLVAAIVLWIVVANLLGVSMEDMTRSKSRPAMVAIVVSVILLHPSLAVTIKRLHDCDLSGWWAALLFGFDFVAMLLDLAGLSGTLDAPNMLGRVAEAGIWAALVLYLLLGVPRGSDGENRYGPDPSEQADASL